jgi:large subunit ribosomal protein L23
MYNILLKPLITEKSLNLASRGWYTFVVEKDSNKREIVQAVNEMFKVHVIEARTATFKQEDIRTGRKKLPGKSKKWKKAMLKLKKDEKIDLFTVEQAHTHKE